MTLDEFRQSLTASVPPANGHPDFRQLFTFGCTGRAMIHHCA
jgi:hypothetical protein